MSSMTSSHYGVINSSYDINLAHDVRAWIGNRKAASLWPCAYLRYVEELIENQISDWNGFAKDMVNLEPPCAGLLVVFLEEPFLHPQRGYGSIQWNRR